MRLSLISLLLLSLIHSINAAEYYIDYAQGDDSHSGLDATQAWKHCPGDRAAKGLAKTCKLKAGDLVRLKGGVRYYGSISLSQNGSKDAPIIIDGNLDGSYGTGPAIIDGAVPISDWTACQSSQEANGNPNWKEIYYTDIDSDAGWNIINLHNLTQSYPVAQEPNMPDPHYQEMATHFHPSKNAIREAHQFKIEAIGMKVNATRPLVALFDNSRLSAVIDNLTAGAVKITLPSEQSISSIGISPQPNYSNPSKIRISSNGKDLLTIHPTAADKKVVEQRFALAQAQSVKELTFHFEAAHPDKNGRMNSWGAVAKLAAYNQDEENVLYTDRRSFYKNPDFFTQEDPHYWDGACMSFFAKPAMVSYHPIKSYNPEKGEVEIKLFTAAQYEHGGRFSVLNTLKVLDRPGEYVCKKLSDGRQRLYFWPQHGLEHLRFSRHHVGIAVAANFVTLRGIHTRGQGGSKSGAGITVYKRGGEGIHIQHCDIALVRGHTAALGITGTNNSLVEHCKIHNNALHSKGTVARLLDTITYRNCTFERNTSTAFDYYTVTNGAVLDCLIRDNQGMHANGLTFYVGCKNIIVDGNEIYDGNAGITFQDGENIIIRNNIIESKHSTGIGVWNGKAYNNIVMCNNIIRGNRLSGSAKNAIFGGNPMTKNFAIYNNIIDGGFDGNVLHKADFNHNIFIDLGDTNEQDLVHENIRISDIHSIFVDAAARDYRLRKNSPVIGKGVALAGMNTHDKNNKPWSNGISIGPYQQDSERDFATGRSVSITGVDLSKASFKHHSTEPNAIVKGAAFSAQGAGSVRVKKEAQSIFGWDNQGHWLEWCIEVETAGNYEICMLQTTATVSKRSFLINGQAIPALQESDMTYTGGWRSWKDHYLPHPIALVAGKNVLRVVGAGGSLNVMNIRAYLIQE